MERTPMTKEEIALELVKHISPEVKEGSAANFSYKLDENAESIAKAYNSILEIISKQSK